MWFFNECKNLNMDAKATTKFNGGQQFCSSLLNKHL